MTKLIFEDNNEFSEFALHIVLATMPQGQEKKFNKGIIDHFYGQYRKKSEKYLSKKKENYWYCADNTKIPVLYNPLRYYILGNYDIAYISLIDNFKFAQRVFEPQLLVPGSDGPDLFFPHTFQSLTGISYSSGDLLKQFFLRKLDTVNFPRRYFISITNLKLNNGFLIGNGKIYLSAAMKMIEQTIREHDSSLDFLLVQSFSWFEISMILFTDNPDDIAHLIKELRGKCVSDLANDDQIIENSLYTSVFKNDQKNKDIIPSANVFADTHTYTGIHADLADAKPNSRFVTAFLKKEIKLKTEIEWQVKPGHMHLLVPQLKEHASHIFNADKRKLITGKNDYSIEQISDCANNNVNMLRYIFKDEGSIFQHVRKIKTRIYFDMTDDGKKEGSRPVIIFHEKLKGIGVTIADFTELDKKLKALKVSRQIRSKILKIFSNYNNGIQDIILFPFFFDFKIFIDQLKKDIEKETENLNLKFQQQQVDYGNEQVSKLEDALMHLIEIFQEGYNIRMLNNYQFEDINDFDLDFNSSVQQLLSIYSTIAIEVGNLFYKEPYIYGPIVQLNLKDTVSNFMSINYYIHHLTSPEFVFATMTKEILNYLDRDDKKLSAILTDYQIYLKEAHLKNALLIDLITSDLIDINYYLNDAMRFIITYDIDFELFYYWFWTYNLQNSSLYDKSGLFNEDHFRKELFRILFIAEFFGCDTSTIVCPLPELYTYWDRHYLKIKKAVGDYCRFLESRETNLATRVMDYLLSKLSISLEVSEKEYLFSISDPTLGIKFLNKLTAKYKGFLVSPIIDRVTKKERAYELLNQGNKGKKVPEGSIIYLQWYTLSYLREIKELNHSKINFLRRNWSDGRPQMSFVVTEPPDHLYAVDQTGGLFFDDMDKLNVYFKLSSKVLTDLWHFSTVRKMKFMLTSFSS